MSDTLKKIRNDFNAALSMDPAATSRLEVALTYAGFHALLFYRMAHWLWKRRIPFLPRALSQLARTCAFQAARRPAASKPFSEKRRLWRVAGR